MNDAPPAVALVQALLSRLGDPQVAGPIVHAIAAVAVHDDAGPLRALLREQRSAIAVAAAALDDLDLG